MIIKELALRATKQNPVMNNQHIKTIWIKGGYQHLKTRNLISPLSQKHVFYVLFCIFEKWYTINSQFRGPEGSESTLSEQHKCYFALLSLLRTSADPRRRLRSTLIALLSKVQGLIWGC